MCEAGVSHRAGQTCADPSYGLLHERDVIVLADALKHEEGCRAISSIGDEVRATRSDSIGLTGAESHLLLRFTQEEPKVSLDDIERILDIAVVMPGYPLSRHP